MWFNQGSHPEINRIINTLEDYISLETELEVVNQERLHVIKYEQGGEYQPHWDYFKEGDNRLNQSGNRIYTFIFYLNDNFKGGGTKFTLLDKVIEPKKGKLIFWNNLNENGSRNIVSKHAGLPVDDGEKWIMTCWVRERPYKPFLSGK
jgi:prolyl 4-hydroxylase